MDLPTHISRTNPFPILGPLSGSFFLLQILIEYSARKQCNSLSDTAYAVSDLGLHCLPMPYNDDDRLILVNVCKWKFICDLARLFI